MPFVGGEKALQILCYIHADVTLQQLHYAVEALGSEGEGHLYAIVMVVMALNASQEYQEVHLNKKQQMGQLQEMINHFWYS